MRYRVGDVVRVTGARVQPASLPLDEVAAAAELADLEERNRGLLDDADVGKRVRNANPKGRPKNDRPSDEALWVEMKDVMAGVARVMSPTEAARIVGRRHELSFQHVLRVTKPFRP